MSLSIAIQYFNLEVLVSSDSGLLPEVANASAADPKVAALNALCINGEYIIRAISFHCYKSD
jgi:hypothetical protein